jgi:hypothetical protein
MYSHRFQLRAIALLLVAMLLAPALAAQSDEGAEATSATTMGFGDIDVALSGGLGALIYPFLEPQVAIGVLPLGPVTLSVGAVGDVGYCLLCNVLQAFDADWRLASYFFGAYGRVLAHLTAVTDAIGTSIPIDPYAGLAVGPRWYVIALDYLPTDESTRVSINSVIIAPQVGARIFLGDESPWYGFAEARYLIEIGFQTQTATVGGQTFTITEEYAGGGGSISLGFGVRL